MKKREMLELAAKAAGIHGQWVEIRKSGQALFPIPAHLQQFILSGTRESWDPLNDDGDEARLEAALGLDVEWQTQHVIVGRTIFDKWQESYARHDGDKQAARRFAGVRAAAEIGKSMEDKAYISKKSNGA